MVGWLAGPSGYLNEDLTNLDDLYILLETTHKTTHFPLSRSSRGTPLIYPSWLSIPAYFLLFPDAMALIYPLSCRRLAFRGASLSRDQLFRSSQLRTFTPISFSMFPDAIAAIYFPYGDHLALCCTLLSRSATFAITLTSTIRTFVWLYITQRDFSLATCHGEQGPQSLKSNLTFHRCHIYY